MRRLHAVLTVIWLCTLAGGVLAAEDTAADRCTTCHREQSPGLYAQWSDSKHADSGIGCLDCHQAEASDSDAFEHHEARIATLVTPADCGRCHEQEAEEVAGSYHATASQILDSADAYLAHVAAGNPVAILGCESCYGAKVQLDPSSPNRLARSSWPNSGIGRINPDGSLGSCNACHARHTFSKAQARQPEARAFDNAEVNALIDNLLSSDPMHRWVREQTDDLKRQIRSGEMQQIYARFFREQ
jgi:formate-dependent nitrite reductase cytochrome c552 subunit